MDVEEDEKEDDLQLLLNECSKQTPSVLAQGNARKLYDFILEPCSSVCYIPNERLRQLKYSILNDNFDPFVVDSCVSNLRKLISNNSWLSPEGGSEGTLLDPSVNKGILDEINKYCLQNHESKLDCMNGDVPFPCTYCSEAKSEYRLQFTSSNGKRFILFPSECKGLADSHYVALLQGILTAADSSLYMSANCDAGEEECAVPGILVYANAVQFYAVYLLNKLPVVAFLTPPLVYANPVNRRMIARSILASAAYVAESVNIINRGLSMGLVSVPRPKVFHAELCFFKPIKCDFQPKNREFNSAVFSNAMSIVEYMMYLYEKMFAIGDCVAFVLFPAGLTRVVDNFKSAIKQIKKFFRHMVSIDHAPVILFPFLRPEAGWTNGKPPTELAHSYLLKLKAAVVSLNKAGVAHIDLRPPNIMWKRNSDGGVDLQIIDFEDSVAFGDLIEYCEYFSADVYRRYPPMENPVQQRASAYHNNWFLLCVKAWFDCVESNDFDDFMQNKYLDVIDEFARFNLEDM